MNRSRRRSVSLLFSAPRLTACAGRQPPTHYVQAQPVKDDPPKPIVVEIPQPVPVPGQLKKRTAIPSSVAIRHTTGQTASSAGRRM